METESSNPDRLTSPVREAASNESDALLDQPKSPGLTQSVKKQLLIYAFPTLLLCKFVISFDSSYVIGNYSRRIAVELHDFKNARWLVLGFLVTESAFCPLVSLVMLLISPLASQHAEFQQYGHAAQVYGHRNAMLFAATCMSVGLLLCSLSNRLWQVALSRVVTGTGTAGIELLVVIIMNDLVQLYELPLWTSATICFGTVGLMLGGPVGAALTDHLGFRPTFGFEFLGMVITFVVLYFALRLPRANDKKVEHGAKRLEYPSATLLLISVAAPLFALNLGGEIFAWSHPVVIVLFCLTPVLVALFYYAETHIAITPIVPKRFIRNRYVAIALACTLPMKFVFDQLRFSFGTYLEARSFGTESSFSDWALTCVYLGRSLGTILSGILIRRYRRFKSFLQLNIIVDIIIYLCFALGWIHPERPAFAPFLAFVGATEGFAEGLWLVALLSLVDDGDQPLLYAFFDLAMAISGDLGIAISLAAEGTLVRSKLNTRLRGYDNASEIIRKSLEDINYIRHLPPKVQILILNALTSSTEAAFGISCCMLTISLISSFYVKELSRSSREIFYVS